MLDYNSTMERIITVFKREFNLILGPNSDEVLLATLEIHEPLARELERALCNEFKLKSLSTIYDKEITLGEIAIDIMVAASYNPDNISEDIPHEECKEANVIFLIGLATAIFFIFLFLFFPF
jgi:hypothetical protein